MNEGKQEEHNSLCCLYCVNVFIICTVPVDCTAEEHENGAYEHLELDEDEVTVGVSPRSQEEDFELF